MYPQERIINIETHVTEHGLKTLLMFTVWVHIYMSQHYWMVIINYYLYKHYL